MPVAISGSGTISGVSVGGLPDGIVDTDMLAATAVTDGKIANTTISEGKLSTSVNTITMVDSWKINTAYSQSAGHGAVTANWERIVTNGPQWTSIGSPLTQSSGEFTFPSTGKYWIQFHFLGRSNGAGTQDYVGARIFVSQNGGTGYNNYSWAYTNSWANDCYFSCCNVCILDVASTTNTKFLMNTECHSSTLWFGNNTNNLTASGFTVMRLGDT
tara:strand:- start:358 stop:1002 length:645 start_codon:yes stop_codon:yes gene_type:complete